MVQEFSLCFPAKDLGTSSQILGMNLRYLEDGSIKLDQERYLREILHDLNMKSAKPDCIPSDRKGGESGLAARWSRGSFQNWPGEPSSRGTPN